MTVGEHRQRGASWPFDDDVPHWLFGRDSEISAVLKRWMAEPFTVLSGPAGAGKTAVLVATLERLIASSSDRDRFMLVQGRMTVPDQTTPSDRNPFIEALLRSWGSVGVASDPERTLTEYLRFLRAASQPPVFAVIDQLESLFVAEAHAHHAKGFLDQLVAAVQQVAGLHLLVVVRDDRLPDLAVLEQRLGQFGKCQLGPLQSKAALEALIESLRAVGRSFAIDSATEVVRNLRTSRLTDVRGRSRQVEADTVEPAQLRVACSVLRRASERDAGNIDGALVRFCECAIRDVARTHALSPQVLSGWLARTFVTDRGTRATVHEGVVDVAGMPHSVVWQLVDRHVLSAGQHLGSRWFHVPNDRLVAPLLECAAVSAGELSATGPSVAACLAEAKAALAEGRLTLAAQRATEAARTSGADDLHIRAAALSCLGQVAVESGRDQQAESYYRSAAALFEAIQDQAGSGRQLAELGRIELRRGQYAEAVDKLQGAEARLPSDIDVRVDLAKALRDSGQPWAATAVLGAALTVAPGAVDALIVRGLIRIETGEFGAALQDLDSAIRLRPSIGQESEIRSARRLAHAHLGESA